MENSAAKLKFWLDALNLPPPQVHLVLGSGLAATLEDFEKGDALARGWQLVGALAFADVPGVNPSTAPGHHGVFKFYRKQGKVLSLQTGRLHAYEGHSPKAVVKPVTALADLGVKNFILTNSAGSLQTYMKAGSVMIITDHVNLTGLNPLTGANDEACGPRFPDMSHAYSARINGLLQKHLTARHVPVHEGVYIGVNGPCFETPAEVKLFSDWGMGATGMSTVLETIALKHRGAEVGGLSFLANMGAGLGDQAGIALSGQEVLDAGEKIAPFILGALFATAEELCQ